MANDDRRVPKWAAVAGSIACAVSVHLLLLATLQGTDEGSLVLALLWVVSAGLVAMGAVAAAVWLVVGQYGPRGAQIANFARGLLVFAGLVSVILSGAVLLLVLS